MNTPRVLDPSCGSRMMWFNPQHPDAIYGNKRTESQVLCDGRQLHIQPATQGMDTRSELVTMVEIANIAPPLRREDCQRLILAALAAQANKGGA